MKRFFRMDEAKGVLREAGLRLTKQRLLILELLHKNESHPTADDLIQTVLDKTGHVTVATVYNTLEVLKKHGLIQKIDGLETKSHYDPNRNEHFHAICRECRKVFDVDLDTDCFVISDDFIPDSCIIQGLCRKCKENQ